MLVTKIAALAAVVLSLVVALVLPVPAVADSPGVTPYADPPFAASCTFRQYGEGVAPPLTLKDQPLCVEYAKRDITVLTGGAVSFAVAEPARLLIAGGACQYWQKDHWSVQLAPGMTPIVRWDGSYWFDLGSGKAGARITGLTVLGQPATLAEAAKFLRPLLPALADALLQYGQGGDGAAASLGLPLNPLCLR
ncbi:hypothetical protein [Marmoricola sp. RAF53]|uniref:hypothetical protein n=1 Tax=Marmoricola sp. RAF53 TaxID=3233059 RepID=UPI003F9C514A